MKGTCLENHIAPDGGWGWMIVLAYSLNNMIVIPILQGFGLLYRDFLLYDLQMTATDISIIITVNSAFGMLFAIFNGPMLRIFGYRKIAIVGALVNFLGNFFTSRSTSFLEFLIFYSIVVSVGVDLLMAAFSLALNTYFVEKRGIATGIAMSFTGIGPILMPLIINALIVQYAVPGCGIVLAGLSLNSFIAALLLQPVKWHYRNQSANGKKSYEMIFVNNTQVEEGNSTNNKALESKKMTDECRPEQYINFEQDHKFNKGTANDSEKEVEHINAMSLLTADEIDSTKQNIPIITNMEEDTDGPPVKSLDDIVRKDTTFLQRIVSIFDLDLLKDPIYVNISLGLSFAFVAEMNFSLMIPFIFGDRGLNTESTAVIMSVLAGSDICSRFLSPIFGNSVKKHVRIVYLVSLVCGLLIRIWLLFCYSYTSMLIVAVCLGFVKGLRSVYTALVIPSYVPLHKLASASGLQMVINGCLLFIVGPLLGYLRDKSNNYDNWIHVINCFTMLTILMWVTEILLFQRRDIQAHGNAINKRTPL